MQPGNRKCGAKTRKGTPCADIAMANGRCKRHGGKATGPKTANTGPATKAATTLGIYERFLSEDDQVIYREAEIGHVENELRLVRVRLSRTVKARKAWEDGLVVVAGEAPQPSGEASPDMVLVEHVDDQSVTKDGDVVDTVKQIKRLPDFDKIEQACLARIESLEKTRKELLKTDDDGDPNAEPGSARLTITGGLPARKA